MKLNIRCSYCSTAVNITLSSGSCLRRCEKQTSFKCPTCDSTTEVWIDTKRKAKGRRLKDTEAQQRAEHASSKREAEECNERLAKILLDTPGCTCADNKPNAHELRYNNMRPDGLRHGRVANGIPGPPRHNWYCPLKPEGV